MRLKSASAEKNPETRARLLEAAGEIFAERGFRSATIRDICRKADANVAAVHYHFGDKEELYAEVLKHWSGIALQKYPPHLGLPDDAPVERRLHAFIRSALFRMHDKGRPAWHGKVMAREMVEPTSALEDLTRDVIRPLYARLVALVREIHGGRPGPEQLRLCVNSILGQIMFYQHARAFICRLTPEQKFETEDIERIADHVTRFSLLAIRRMAKPAKDGGA
jgi:AcrR family transcriptional regulator